MAPRRKPRVEEWTTTRVAEYLNIAESSARAQLAHWGLKPVAREPGRGGQNLYNAADVKTRAAKRPRKPKTEETP